MTARALLPVLTVLLDQHGGWNIMSVHVGILFSSVKNSVLLLSIGSKITFDFSVGIDR